MTTPTGAADERERQRAWLKAQLPLNTIVLNIMRTMDEDAETIRSLREVAPSNIDERKEVEEELAAQSAELEKMRKDAEKMRAFCREALDEFWEGDGDMQDMGERHGLLIPTIVNEACGEGCSCEAYGADFPTDCYKFAPFLAAHDMSRDKLAPADTQGEKG